MRVLDRSLPGKDGDSYLSDFFAARKILRQRYGAHRENTFYETVVEASNIASAEVSESDKHKRATLDRGGERTFPYPTFFA